MKKISFKINTVEPPYAVAVTLWKLSYNPYSKKNNFVFFTREQVYKFSFYFDTVDQIYPKLSFKEKIKLLEQFLDCFPNPPVEGENLIDKQKIVFFKGAVFEIQIQNSLKNGNFLL